MYLETKLPLERESFFHIHGKATLKILHLTFICKGQQVGPVIPVPEFLRENASQESLTQAVLSLFCQIKHGAPETKHQVLG